LTKTSKDIKLVFITSRFPYSLEKGDKLRAYFQLRELNKYFEVHLVSLTENPISKSDKEEIQRIVHAVHIYYVPIWKQWLNATLSLFSKRPVQIGYFYHQNIYRKINDLLDHIKPDHIYCQLIRVSEYVKHYKGCQKTLDYMDCLSKGLERRLDILTFPSNFLFQMEYRRVLNYENEIFNYFNHHVIISEQDRNDIPHENRNKIWVIPNGVNDNFFNHLQQKEEFDLVFTGNMSYPPNVNAAKFIVNDILPCLNPEIKVLISGAAPVKEVKDLASNKVTVTGWVDDIRKSYSSGKIFVAPMFIGSGLQNKLLEAMASGRPCITSPLANNALKAIPDKEILLASNADEFRLQIMKLLHDKNLYNRIAENGLNFVKNNYNWQNITANLVEKIRSASN